MEIDALPLLSPFPASQFPRLSKIPHPFKASTNPPIPLTKSGYLSIAAGIARNGTPLRLFFPQIHSILPARPPRPFPSTLFCPTKLTIYYFCRSSPQTFTSIGNSTERAVQFPPLTCPSARFGWPASPPPPPLHSLSRIHSPKYPQTILSPLQPIMPKIPFLLLILLQILPSPSLAQLDASLLGGQNFAPKPTIPPDLAKYFELDGHARELVDTLIAPRPGGFFPEKTFEISAPRPPPSPTESPDQLQQIGKAVEQFLAGPPSTNEVQLPPGFGQGFSIGSSSGKNLLAFQQNSNPVHVEEQSSADLRRSPEKPPQSSIAGIPNDFPKLPKFPLSALPPEIRRQQPPQFRQSSLADLPKFVSKPEVPEGGLGPVAQLDPMRPNSVSISEPGLLSSSAADGGEYGGSSADSESSAPGGLIGTVLDLFGFNKEGKPAADAGGIGRAVGSLLGGNNSPLPGKQMISNVLYKALTSGSVQQSSNDSSSPQNSTSLPTLPPNPLAALLPEFNASTPITLSQAQQEAIGENLEMIQNLIVQPSSPLCNPKPEPVGQFQLDAFMGQWYQVVYSPLVAQSGCSVVSYRKIADVNHGGIGSIFEVFEYSTDGTPYSKPKITSGYGILKQQGELIFRTTAHQEDVNIHVLFVGPLNGQGLYEFVVLTSNCNYPVYVFARDPIQYKQRYETAVMQMLEQKGVVNGISKLLNIVAPVDASTCTFPANLFAHSGVGQR